MVYLEDHPPARSQFRRTRRADATGAIVVHTAENNTDLKLPDTGAEGVANFISKRTDAAGSYHSVVDSDSTVNVGRYEWEMFGEGTGGNRWCLHLSFATHAADWDKLPFWWFDGAMDQAAAEAYAMCVWFEGLNNGKTIPPSHITAAEYRAGHPGFIGHGELDPGRRSDPGSEFDWAEFLNRYQKLLAAPPASTEPGTPQPPEVGATFEDRIAARVWNLEAIDLVQWAYQFHLGRVPTRTEIASWLPVMRKDGWASVRWAIANSEENVNGA